MRLFQFSFARGLIKYKLLSAGLFSSLLSCAAVANPVILVLGDSLSAAYGIRLSQGWVALMDTALREDYPTSNVINASISGETTIGGLARFPRLLEEYHPDLVIIQLGANDGLRGYPLNSLEQNLHNLIELGKRSDSSVILIPMRIPPNYGKRYAEQFMNTYHNVARQQDVMLTPFILDGVAGNPEYIQPDGLHPQAHAQPIMLNNVMPQVKKLLALIRHQGN
jgi:acyl-CoA thioesterase-1